METACRARAQRRGEKEIHAEREKEGSAAFFALLLLALLFFFHPVEAVNGFLLAGWLSTLVLLSVEPYGLLLSFRLL